MLRRPYADALRDAGPLTVWAGPPESGYVRGLRLSAGEASVSFVAWYLRLLRASVTGKPVFAFNAGEFGVTKAYFGGMIAALPVLALIKVKGGRVVWLGGGVKVRKSGFMWPFDLLARWCDVLLWRDVDSPRLMGRGAVMPDWGFGLDGQQTLAPDGPVTERPLLAISLRGDREYPSLRWVRAVRELATRLSLEPVVVVQVEDDDAMGSRLARDLGARFVGWQFDDHLAQEAVVRATYAQSRVTLSDRLHGLIIAATEGSVPLGWCDRATRKISQHMEVVGLPWVGPDGRDNADRIGELTPDALAELVPLAHSGVRSARIRVDAVRADLHDTLTSISR
ncbi:hypothetical protein ASC59_16480 [Leifsonia sp. Root1293]|nr:hypothetical protein ASC59_16480 [Leifsonia sp. Root1293]KRA09303.1 hypothetical protein ASD61_16475 [Leifsonia sp. Root60]